MTSGILYSVMRVEGSILVEATLSQFLEQETRHTCFSRLRSINECLVIDWGGQDRWLGSNIMQQTGTCGPWCPVPELRHCQCPWMTLAKLQVDCSAGPKTPRSTWRLVSRSQPLPFSIFGRRGGSGAVALMSSCCRLYNKRSTKHRMCLALSGYLSLMQTGWNFLLFVFLRIVLSCERRSHVSANV